MTSDAGERCTAQFLIMGSGGLTEVVLPDIPGRNSFKGAWYHTARWPKQPVDFSGKRVGVFGTGATGIQVIQTIAAEVGHLTVFQRTPTYTIAIRNPKFDDGILVSKANSWYMGSNIEGKRRSLLAYAGGVDVYRQLCNEVKAGGYDEFELA